MKVELFSATWCANCPAAKRTLDLAGIGYTVVDIDDNMEQASDYGIRGIPAIAVTLEDGSRKVFAGVASAAQAVKEIQEIA